MNIGTLKNVVTSKTARQVLKLKKNSPGILFAGGVVGMVSTVVLASKATLKLDGILADHEKDMIGIKNLVHDEYSEDDRKQDTLKRYAKTTHNLVKLYGPTLIVGTFSVAALTGSHHIMSQRNAGVMAAYTALEKGFEKYRERVLNDVGEEKEREYRYGVQTREVAVETDQGIVVQREKVADIDGEYSVYARLFDRDTSQSWSPQPEYNLIFLKAQQNYFNDKLRARGHVFLNEVYDALGLDRTPEGQVVGWVMGAEGVDNYVDFGIFDTDMMPRHYNFFVGRENGVWLDFNVDGVVYKKI